MGKAIQIKTVQIILTKTLIMVTFIKAHAQSPYACVRGQFTNARSKKVNMFRVLYTKPES